ncbi:kinase-like domain-containing protein [Gigaspora rosea]|uniref:Kinase-like domain-containing protein n=1 Tax=Gigaspora rosea TaxID=44941 RepID=A0A397U1A5_9GLOM|nr:kinase-like domain-containing protein [Gigaspora rosea]
MENLPEIVVQPDGGPTNKMQLYHFSKELGTSITSDDFSPLIEEACQIENFYRSYDNIQLNKRICNQLGLCIISAVYNVKMLQIQCNDDEFLTVENYKSFNKFLQNLGKIKDFIENISQIRRLKRFIQETDSGISLERLKDEYFQLLKEFRESTSSLELVIRVDNKTDDINKDIEETIKFIQAFECNFEGDSMFSFIDKISVDIQNVANKELSEKDIIPEPHDNQNVRFIECELHKMKRFSVQAALLKNLKGLVNISKFFGGIKHHNQMKMIIEWSQYGDLMTYYMNHKLDILIKLKFALEICSALVFLNAVNFLHRDIKSENILITNDLKAKITNFCHSRLVTEESGKLDIKSTGYIVPEIYNRNTRTHFNTHTSSTYMPEQYDFRCEVYCFGVLLWELAHEKSPYGCFDRDKIYQILYSNHLSKNFDKNLVPEKYVDISIKALRYDPKNRPTICDMYKELYSLYI